MKTLILSILFLFSLSSGFSQGKNRDRKIKAYLDTKQFFAPETGNYVEVYIRYDARSINFIGKDNGLIGEVGVNIKISSNDSLMASDAFRLSSPFMSDSIIEDFYSLNRFPLSPGAYTMSIELFDVNSKHQSIQSESTLTVENLSNAISISGLQVAEYITKETEGSMFNKSGFNIIPRLTNYYPAELNKIPVYFELYNSHLLPDSVFGIRRSIVSAMLKQPLDNFSKFTKLETAPLIPMLKVVDINDLYTGQYILKYEILNKQLKTIAVQTYEFERTKTPDFSMNDDVVLLDPAFQLSISEDSIGYYLESLIPISGPAETKNIIELTKLKDGKKSREYIQKYWRFTAPNSPYDSWIAYKLQVQLVERRFGNNFQEGFETDRGRVFLKYGAPSAVTKNDFSSSEYPYEIWRYTNIGAFSNKRFVFYNPNLVNRTYQLIHSDMLGEIKNPQWHYLINSRNTVKGVDDPNQFMQDSNGRSALDDYNQN